MAQKKTTTTKKAVEKSPAGVNYSTGERLEDLGIKIVEVKELTEEEQQLEFARANRPHKYRALLASVMTLRPKHVLVLEIEDEKVCRNTMSSIRRYMGIYMPNSTFRMKMNLKERTKSTYRLMIYRVV